MMRRLAVELGIPFITNVEAARAAVTALKTGGRGALEVESLSEIHGVQARDAAGPPTTKG